MKRKVAELKVGCYSLLGSIKKEAFSLSRVEVLQSSLLSARGLF